MPRPSAPRLSPALAALPTGWEALDRRLAGGWPAGALTELCGRGRCTLALQAVREAQTRGQPVGWVEGPGTFCPPAAGVDLARLALVAPPDARRLPARAWLAADLLLRSRAFGLLVLDLPVARPSLAVCFRLARQAAAARSVLLLLSAGSGPGRGPVAGSAAGLLLAVRQRHAPCAHWMLPPPPALELTVLRQRRCAGGAAGHDLVLAPLAVAGPAPALAPRSP
jgi:hypothetical protein